jgi:hypothetical protein
MPQQSPRLPSIGSARTGLTHGTAADGSAATRFTGVARLPPLSAAPLGGLEEGSEEGSEEERSDSDSDGEYSPTGEGSPGPDSPGSRFGGGKRQHPLTVASAAGMIDAAVDHEAAVRTRTPSPYTLGLMSTSEAFRESQNHTARARCECRGPPPVDVASLPPQSAPAPPS